MFFNRTSPNVAYKILNNSDVTKICQRFEVDSTTYSTDGFGAGKVCEGMFIIKSLRYDPEDDLTVSFPANFRYMHFSNSNLSTLNIAEAGNHLYPVVDQHGLFRDNYNLLYDPKTINQDLLNHYGEHPFNTSIKYFYPSTTVNGSYNTHAMHFANQSNMGSDPGTGIPGAVKCSINSFTTDNEHDLWSHDSNGNVRDMPAIVKCRDRSSGAYYPNDDQAVSQLQQTAFNINAVSTYINDIGSPTWKKTNVTFYETVNDFQREFGDNSDLAGWNNPSHYNYHGMNSCYQGMLPTQTPSTSPIMLDIILKTDAITNTDWGDYQNFVYGISEVKTGTNTCNFTRNALPLMDQNDTVSSFFANKAFMPDDNTWGYDTSTYRSLEDRTHLMCIPVLFSKLSAGGSSRYGQGDSHNAFQSDANSYKDIFGLANLVATKFKLSNSNYYNFVIYGQSAASTTTWTISYAIDLRQLSTTGAVAGKTIVSTASQSTDVLLIAHKNIYVLSTQQVNSYIHNIHCN